MAKFTYNEPTNREDLSDVITNISPTDTPLCSMFGKAKANGTKHEFPEDELADAAENAHIEGAQNTAVPAPARVRKYNYTQIMKRGYEVTETQQAVTTAGVANEFQYNMLKAMKEIGKDLELAITTSTASDAGTTTTARKMAGVPGLVTTNQTTTASLRLSDISDALQTAWEAGGSPNKLIVSGKNKRAISAFTTSNTKNIPAQQKKLVEAIDVLDTDFGRVEVKASRFMTDTKIFVLDPSYFKIAWLRPFKRVDLPKTHDGRSGIIVGEMTLEGRGEKGQAIITVGS